MHEESPLTFQLLGDSCPSKWIHPDPKERGAQLQNVSAIELRHLLGVIPHRGCIVREEAPLMFQLLGDCPPSEWIHPDPKERGAQLQNVSAIKLRRLLDSYYQPAGLSPSESAPPP